ncbi:flagellar hook-associated protein FlgL [Hydrogenimonas sp.]
MRITQNNFYNRFVSDQQSIKQQLDRLSRQISSGMKIQYGYEDPQVFTDTLRLDYEERTLSQAVSVATDAQNFANNTDSVMFQFTDGLVRFKTLLIQAANGSNADSNYYAIANELESLKEHFVNLGNSSINGRFLFSGTRLDVKPLDEAGHYYGNGEELKAVVGAGVEIAYNIPGLDLFYGEDNNVNRVVTTNVPLRRQDGEAVTLATTMEEITGSANDFNFTMQGRKSDGSTFSVDFTLPSDATVEDLLTQIENAYGTDQVETALVNGYLTVRDKREGRSLLDFHLYGKEDTATNPAELAFVKSDGVGADIYAAKVPFTKVKEGSFRGNMPQIVKADQSFATPSTKLLETAGVDDLTGRTLTFDYSDGTNTNTLSISVDNDYTYGQLFDAIETELENNGFGDARASLDRNGRLVVEADGLASAALYSSDTPPAMLFNTNDALTVDDPKHDFFAAIDEAIEAVRSGLLYPDGENGALARNPGIENALARIDHVISHVGKEHTKIGAMSNALNYSVERSETLKINVQTLRSEILDTDIGEASVKLNQLSLNFQALMASIAKVQNLSLVNYM